MFSRQRALLRLIGNDGDRIEKLRLVKLAFLLSNEADAPRAGVYEFVPYKRGPFSFTLYHELRSLERDGWLMEVGNEVTIAASADTETASIESDFLALVDSVSRRQRDVTTSAMVNNVYRNYPWFTLNSEVVQKRAVGRPEAEPAVFTVGYEGIMVDGLLDLLLRNGIKRLIDVRSNPIARRYGFHKSTLSRLCGDMGIEYIHVPSLGVPSAWRTELSEPRSYQRLFERYDCEILPTQATAVEYVARLVIESPSALMCMEADHLCCHRRHLGIEVSRRTSMPVVELREP